MKGFDKQFKNLPDYILKITYQIWEDKDVESIRKYYADGIPVRSPEIVEEPGEREITVRRFKIEKDDLDKYGYTARCPKMFMPKAIMFPSRPMLL